MIIQSKLLAGVDSELLKALEAFHWGLSKWYHIQIWKGHFDADHGQLLKSGKGVMFTVQRDGSSPHIKVNKDITDVLGWFDQNYSGYQIQVIQKERFDVFLLKAKGAKSKAKPAPAPEPEPEWNSVEAPPASNEEVV